jgi:hypothetical protein
VFILNGLRAFLVVSIHSKEFTGRAGAIAQSIDGSLVAGLGRSVLRPYVCARRKTTSKHASTRSLDLRADMNACRIKELAICEFGRGEAHC